MTTNNEKLLLLHEALEACVIQEHTPAQVRLLKGFIHRYHRGDPWVLTDAGYALLGAGRAGLFELRVCFELSKSYTERNEPAIEGKGRGLLEGLKIISAGERTDIPDMNDLMWIFRSYPQEGMANMGEQVPLGAFILFGQALLVQKHLGDCGSPCKVLDVAIFQQLSRKCHLQENEIMMWLSSGGMMYDWPQVVILVPTGAPDGYEKRVSCRRLPDYVYHEVQVGEYLF